MTEPHPARPVPGPPRAGVGPADASHTRPDSPPADRDGGDHAPFADLDQRPVADHVAVYEAEHSRLQRELGTIDQL
jgi:hypothetical protein